MGANSDFSLATGPIYLSDVDCTGTEEFLVNCSTLGTEHDCTHLQDAGVDCEGELLSLLLVVLAQAVLINGHLPHCLFLIDNCLSWYYGTCLINEQNAMSY